MTSLLRLPHAALGPTEDAPQVGAVPEDDESGRESGGDRDGIGTAKSEGNGGEGDPPATDPSET